LSINIFLSFAIILNTLQCHVAECSRKNGIDRHGTILGAMASSSKKQYTIYCVTATLAGIESDVLVTFQFKNIP